MHELAIAESIIELARSEAGKRGFELVSEIGVRVGALAGVNCEALRFGFEALTADTPLQGVTLEIEEIPARGRCLRCSLEHTLPDIVEVCPRCQGFGWEVLQGEELDLIYVAGSGSEPVGGCNVEVGEHERQTDR
ncbi:MAG: hydrogenase maturation nickel metallochaperone HypA [bacterium]